MQLNLKLNNFIYTIILIFVFTPLILKHFPINVALLNNLFFTLILIITWIVSIKFVNSKLRIDFLLLTFFLYSFFSFLIRSNYSLAELRPTISLFTF